MSDWNQRRFEALDAVQLLKAVLEDRNVEDERLFSAYLDAKRCLADAFRALGEARYGNKSDFSTVVGLVENHLQALGQFPEKYRKVSGFGKVHRLIFAYLAERVGLDVNAGELRILTGDAVHTERRARDLRDLGLTLEARRAYGGDIYVLRSTKPDVREAARIQLKRNLLRDKGLPVETRNRLLEISAEV